MAETLREHPRPGSNSNGQLVSYAFGSHAGSDGEATNSSHDKGGPVGFGLYEDETPAIRAGRTQTVATSITLASDPISAEELAQPSTKRNGDPGVVQVGASVRRLMPVECERLQALPDDWTQLGDTTDSKRYAALGDAVTSSVAEWLGRRIIQEGTI